MVHLRPSGTESGKLVRSFSIWNIWRQEKMLLRLFDLYLLQGKHFIRRQHRDLQMQVPPNAFQSRRNMLKSRVECINMEGIISPPSWDRVTWSVKIWMRAMHPPPPLSPSPSVPTALTSLNIISFPASKSLLLQTFSLLCFVFQLYRWKRIPEHEKQATSLNFQDHFAV